MYGQIINISKNIRPFDQVCQGDFCKRIFVKNTTGWFAGSQSTYRRVIPICVMKPTEK
jgi:hypothetical protein